MVEVGVNVGSGGAGDGRGVVMGPCGARGGEYGCCPVWWWRLLGIGEIEQEEGIEVLGCVSGVAGIVWDNCDMMVLWISDVCIGVCVGHPSGCVGGFEVV